MSARSKMTMRAVLKRNTQGSADAWGQPNPKDITEVNPSLPCWLYSKTSRREVDGNKLAGIEEVRLMIPLATDIKPGDLVTDVTDGNSKQIHPGDLIVQGSPQVYAGHWEATLIEFNQGG